MIFKKKRPMIDVRELQRRGVVRLPKDNDPEIQTDNDGFVNIGESSSPSQPESSNPLSNNDLFGLAGAASTSSSTDSFSTQTDGYNKREVDAKITNLDNKIYKLEQRMELLERKAGVNQGQSVGPAGW